jgi:hypothetical protein
MAGDLFFTEKPDHPHHRFESGTWLGHGPSWGNGDSHRLRPETTPATSRRTEGCKP